MALLTKNFGLYAENETVYGTDTTPDTNFAVLAYNLKFSEETSINKRTPLASTLSQYPAVPGGTLSKVSFDTELRWNGNIAGSSATAWEAEPLFKASGHTCTYAPESGGGVGDGYVTIAPSSDEISAVTDGSPAAVGPNSATIAFYTGRSTGDATAQRLHKRTGCVGAFQIGGDANGLGMISWEFIGRHVAPTDAAALTPTYDSDTYRALALFNHVFSLGAFTGGIVRSFRFNSGIKVVERADMTETYGFYGATITGREPTVEFTVEATTIGGWDPWTLLRGGGMAALTIGPIGATNGNIITINVPGFQITNVESNDDSGIEMYRITGQCNRVSGDDEYNIVMS